MVSISASSAPLILQLPQWANQQPGDKFTRVQSQPADDWSEVPCAVSRLTSCDLGLEAVAKAVQAGDRPHVLRHLRSAHLPAVSPVGRGLRSRYQRSTGGLRSLPQAEGPRCNTLTHSSLTQAGGCHFPQTWKQSSHFGRQNDNEHAHSTRLI